MDKKLKAKWLKALRSGKYKQAKAALKARQGYCCIGVLAEVKGCSWKRGKPYSKDHPVGHFESVAGSIQYAGTEYLKPDFIGISLDAQQELADLNDSGRSFAEIADHIERKL